MIKTISIKCPSCNTMLKINIDDDKVLSVEINDSTILLSENEISQCLKNHGIEFG